ncbi:hypothetical protein MPNT_50163 [Candidatus Methylacidithermus pantelleriae]|uniref:Uncharacterized protein n=1 Tax=Candidatus Methylacidithermus pantelleriae TaxID=2744239 RepID=A0A8J2BLG0_9BACT|nr:hypothetical protein MPNT_50163 [Candidatus Methylacidithermus pantelleriae]
MLGRPSKGKDIGSVTMRPKRLYSIDGRRITVALRLRDYSKQIFASSRPKGPGWVFRERTWYPSLVVETEDRQARASGPMLGMGVRQKNFAGISTGKIFDGGKGARQP